MRRLFSHFHSDNKNNKTKSANNSAGNSNNSTRSSSRKSSTVNNVSTVNNTGSAITPASNNDKKGPQNLKGKELNQNGVVNTNNGSAHAKTNGNISNTNKSESKIKRNKTTSVKSATPRDMDHTNKKSKSKSNQEVDTNFFTPKLRNPSTVNNGLSEKNLKKRQSLPLFMNDSEKANPVQLRRKKSFRDNIHSIWGTPQLQEADKEQRNMLSQPPNTHDSTKLARSQHSSNAGIKRSSTVLVANRNVASYSSDKTTANNNMHFKSPNFKPESYESNNLSSSPSPIKSNISRGKGSIRRSNSTLNLNNNLSSNSRRNSSSLNNLHAFLNENGNSDHSSRNNLNELSELPMDLRTPPISINGGRGHTLNFSSQTSFTSASSSPQNYYENENDISNSSPDYVVAADNLYHSPDNNHRPNYSTALKRTNSRKKSFDSLCNYLNDRGLLKPRLISHTVFHGNDRNESDIFLSGGDGNSNSNNNNNNNNNDISNNNSNRNTDNDGNNSNTNTNSNDKSNCAENEKYPIDIFLATSGENIFLPTLSSQDDEYIQQLNGLDNSNSNYNLDTSITNRVNSFDGPRPSQSSIMNNSAGMSSSPLSTLTNALNGDHSTLNSTENNPNISNASPYGNTSLDDIEDSAVSYKVAIVVSLKKRTPVESVIIRLVSDTLVYWYNGVPPERKNTKEFYKIGELQWNLKLSEACTFIQFDSVQENETSLPVSLFKSKPLEEIITEPYLPLGTKRKNIFVDSLKPMIDKLGCSPDTNTINTSTKFYAPGEYVFFIPIYFANNIPETIYVPSARVRHTLHCGVLVNKPLLENDGKHRHNNGNDLTSSKSGGSSHHGIHIHHHRQAYTHNTNVKNGGVNSAGSLSSSPPIGGKFFKKFLTHINENTNNEEDVYDKFGVIYGDKSLNIVRTPPLRSISTADKPIYINRVWNDALSYEISLPQKYVTLNSELPIKIKLVPTDKSLNLKRLRVGVVEKITLVSKGLEYEFDQVDPLLHDPCNPYHQEFLNRRKKDRVLSLVEVKSKEKSGNESMQETVVTNCKNENIFSYSNDIIDSVTLRFNLKFPKFENIRSPSGHGSSSYRIPPPYGIDEFNKVLSANHNSSRRNNVINGLFGRKNKASSMASNEDMNGSTSTLLNTIGSNHTHSASPNNSATDSTDVTKRHSSDLNKNNYKNSNKSNSTIKSHQSLSSRRNSTSVAATSSNRMNSISAGTTTNSRRNSTSATGTSSGIAINAMKQRHSNEYNANNNSTAPTISEPVIVSGSGIKVQHEIKHKIPKRGLYTDSVNFSNIHVKHKLEVLLRISKYDKQAQKTRHYEVLIDTPICMMSDLCSSGNMDLPTYDMAVMDSVISAHELDELAPPPSFEEAISVPASPLAVPIKSANVNLNKGHSNTGTANNNSMEDIQFLSLSSADPRKINNGGTSSTNNSASVTPASSNLTPEIGRASCRERVSSPV
ncbi:uncharacterized protein SCODWIG_03433 [Saccharomycodes ludwigii]|uniref:Arrestin C-terminal-like domain-containing protein n=1 Tax=Saccharomycodes ludwigii TaxID=36035 RepID=A0A376BAI7_9ASCO|nr:uncharacterized protein SCODWIG_03433 [Saccharomycodes ludwigii]